MDLRTLQLNLPWTIKYSRDFRANPQPHKDFSHALIHAGKALGKLFAFADDMDHDRDVALQTSPTASARYLADLVICALRACNTFPGTVIDLEAATIERLESKNGAKLPQVQSINEAVRIAATEAPNETESAEQRQRTYREVRRINIHDEEQRVRLLVAQIDDAQARIGGLEEALGSTRATLGRRDATIASLEKQLDEERADALGRASLAEIHAKADVDKHLATISRMQPLVLEAQRVAPMIYSHLCAIRLAYDQDPEVDSKIVDHLDGARSLSQRLDLVGEGYAQACTDAADLDMPF